MREIYLVGEDEVTKAIIRKIMAVYTPELTVKGELPARGSEIKNKIANFNRLAAHTPVVLLTDLDTEDCAPVAKSNLLKGIVQNENFIVNVAVDEAEAWLLADQDCFSNFLGVDKERMPTSALQKQGGSVKRREMQLPLKASYYLTHNLALQSSKDEIKAQIGSQGRRCKGKEYNTALVPFIEKEWDVEKARVNSDSLDRMIRRLIRLNEK